jgi:Mycobacterium membrane protein
MPTKQCRARYATPGFAMEAALGLGIAVGPLVGVWMPLLLVVVIALAAYAVVSIHDMFGANPAVAGKCGQYEACQP